MRLRVSPEALLAVLAVLACTAVAAASLRHTGSLAFPIDDAYIYSNYVLEAAQGHPFTYNPGETSGGITGVGWYLVCTVFYLILSPMHGILAGFGPPVVQSDSALSSQAGHLYLAAYLPGVLCLAATAIGTYKLATLVLYNEGPRNRARNALCWVMGATAAADLGLVWGAMSGLEPALSTALVVWSIYFLVVEESR